MSLIPVLIKVGFLLSPLFHALLSSSLALSFANGEHPWVSGGAIGGPRRWHLSITRLCVVLLTPVSYNRELCNLN